MIKTMSKTILCAVLAIASQIHAAPAEPPAAMLEASGFEGGLVVHIGCGDGKQTAAIGAGKPALVHGLDTDPANIARARASFQSQQINGRVSADLFDGEHLPYSDNLVNAIVVSDAASRVSKAELMRVLAPGGSAWSLTGKGWRKETKAWPDELDEWTHYLHSPNNNAVARDTVVGPPRHFQWIAKQRFSRSHDHLASVTAVVSAGGRLFSIDDKGPIAFVAAAPRWKLIARDAFNGIKLWERDIARWEYHLRDFRSGPADIARRLVAIGDRVYVTLGYGQPVVALDAATGKTVRTYDGTAGTREILCDRDTLLLVLGQPHADWGAKEAKEIVSQPDYSPPFEEYTPPGHALRIASVSASTGKTKWTNAQTYTRDLMPSTLTLAEGRVFFQNLDELVCLDAAGGKLLWKAPRPIHRYRLAWSTPTVVAHNGVVFSADRAAAKKDGKLLWLPSGGYHQYIRGNNAKGELIAFDIKDGKRLWDCPVYEGFNSPVDILIADDLVWTGQYAWGNDPGVTQARDLRTGEVKRTRPPDSEFLPRIGHARCHRAKATSKYLILGRRGIEMVDLKSGHMTGNLWVRGICQYGIMPANGLVYAPPHACGCNVNDMIKSGYLALAPLRKEPPRNETEPLTKGPAYSQSPPKNARPSNISASQPFSIPASQPSNTPASQPSNTPASQHFSISAFQPFSISESWPTYRKDAGRSGATATAAPAKPEPAWDVSIGGKLTPPVVAEGVLLVAAKDNHTVHALDAATGKPRWTFTAAARVDSPPTVDRGRVLFGSADGRVYCLRLSDGERIWTFRAAPRDRLIVVEGQLESAWPVSGSVLVLDDTVYFAAGRNSYLDGGLFIYKLNAITGEQLGVHHSEVEKEKRDSGIAKGGCLPDILSSDGESIFMRAARFDRDLAAQGGSAPHLWGSVGFLDHNWWHRTYWQYGASMGSGWGGWPKAARTAPAGRLLVMDDTRIYGYGRSQHNIPGGHVGVDGRGAWGPVGKGLSPWTYYRLFGRALPGKKDDSAWSCRIPVVGQALLLAGAKLLVAGPEDPLKEIPNKPSEVDPIAATLDSCAGGKLLIVSAADGKTLNECKLPSPPVFAGMIAAANRLYLSTKAGTVVCME